MCVGLYGVKTINLRYNDIEVIEAGSFEDLVSLMGLILENNNIKTIPQTAFDLSNYPTQLYKDALRLGNNPLQCNQSLAWVKKVRSILLLSLQSWIW